MTRMGPEFLVTGFQFFVACTLKLTGLGAYSPINFFLKIIYSEIEPGDNLHE